MYRKFVAFILIIILSGCAAYKQLKPKPEISFAESGYIELKKGDKYFELKKDKKYFIQFPSTQQENFYLVLNISNNDWLSTYLTTAFDDGKGTIIKMEDEGQAGSGTSLYRADKSVQIFYWVIESVRQDMNLEMEYRYTPIWRYKFETKYAEFQETLKNNSIDRTAYNEMGPGFDFNRFKYSEEINKLNTKNAALKGLKKELAAIESIFPVTIKNTNDEAYLNYIDLNQRVNDELLFHEKYSLLLNTFKKEVDSQSDPAKFIAAIPDLLKFTEKKNSFPPNIVTAANDIFKARLAEVGPYFEEVINSKNDASRMGLDVDNVEALYAAVGQKIPADVKNSSGYVRAYNQKYDDMKAAESKINDLKMSVKNHTSWPANTYFQEKSEALSKIIYQLPATGFYSAGKFANTSGARQLDDKVRDLRNQAASLDNGYKRAAGIVPQINRLGDEKAYSQMIRLLKQNSDLGFLADMYSNLDQLSLTTQSASIKAALNRADWLQAESGLKSLHYDTDFLNPSVILPKKQLLVKSMEDTLLYKVETISKQRAEALVTESIMTLDGLEEIYNSPVFLPAHDITFTSGSQQELQTRKKALMERLLYFKEQVFPAQAIEKLYKEFSRDPGDNGVLKARAIVIHGSHYKGTDRKIKNLVAECDPWASKWITSPKDYRKIYVLPVSSNKLGENEYVFRVNLRLPSDARFPVFDVNIKLPKEIAKNAGERQWYEQMTMNKNPLKNEGRFTITAPGPQNDYECQISPLQMVKDGDNVLEVRFKHPSFKVLEVSLMAQKPIIKKN